MKRIVVYSHDTFGLGNLRRMLSVCQSLLEEIDDVSVLMITGSSMIQSFRLHRNRFDYLKLPCLSRNSDGIYETRSSGFEFKDIVNLRADMIFAALRNFRPDLMIVDKKPLGVESELEPALEFLHSQYRCKCVLLLRDILDSPEKTRKVWRKNEYFQHIEKFYGRVLVVGCESVFDIRREYSFPPNIARMVRFCGYINRANSSKFNNKADLPWGVGQKRILVTPGGGEDGAWLVRQYLAAQKDWKGAREHFSVLVTGPEMPKTEVQEIRNASRSLSNFHVEEFSNNIPSMMKQADLVVSMAGYNTICEILSLRKSAVVVPRITPVREQWIRAELLAKRGLIRAIHPEKLTPNLLAKTIRDELSRIAPKDCLSSIDLNGLQTVAMEVKEFLFRSDRNAIAPEPRSLRDPCLETISNQPVKVMSTGIL